MNMFDSLTQNGIVAKSTESENEITYKILLSGKVFSLTYYFTDDGWEYEITDSIGNVVDSGVYSRIA